MPDLRRARVGDHLPTSVVDRVRPRRLEATALLLPGLDSVDEYIAALEGRAADFASWDGRLLVVEPDGAPDHRLAVVDRYGQVYALHDAASAEGMPDADELVEWFRFLATACPECGVLDDPLLAGPTA